MILLTSLAPLIGLPVLAYRGAGYRGLYFAAALAGVLFGMVAFALAQVQPAEDSAQQIAGARIAHEYFPSIGLWLWASACGAVLGGIMYQPRKVEAVGAAAPAGPTDQTCPVCGHVSSRSRVTCSRCHTTLGGVQD